MNKLNKENMNNFFENKMSQGHIEMILSFVLFAGFLVFVFFILTPFFEINSEIYIKELEVKLINNITSKVGKLSVIVNSSHDCYDVTPIVNSHGEKFIEVADNIIDPEFPRRYTLYFGDFFDSSLVGVVSCVGELDRNYSLGNYREEEIVDYNKAQELKDNYVFNYLSLKDSLDVGDFTFNFTDLDRNQVYYFNDPLKSLGVEKNIPENVNVFSKEILIRTMDDKGKIYEMILNLRTW